MTQTLLFDLDDTLLNTNVDAFISAYFKKLAGFMSVRFPPQQFIQALLASTQGMYASKDPAQTLEQAFGAQFYAMLGVSQQEVAPLLEQFYDEVFPTLADVTSRLDGAVEMVEWALANGWEVAVATDPLFPRKAILHRLRWAGLSPEKYSFKLISDFQSFHFAKASVAFYPEFLAAMGWKDSPVLMVGDSFERDIAPSLAAGLPVFWFKPSRAASVSGVPQGNFGDLRAYLSSVDLDALKVDYTSPSALTAFLLSTPAVLHGRSHAMDMRAWTQRPAPDEWSFLEVLCHLRDVDAEVNLPRIQTILKDSNPFIAAQTTDQWALERDYNQQDPAAALDGFITVRKQITGLLSGLAPFEWQRLARHTIFGPTNLAELVRIMVDHDRVHLDQALSVALNLV